MGLQDRDYYWEDRKRRENKFDKKDTYYRPKEFRRSGAEKPSRPPNGWQTPPDIKKQQWKLLLAFFAGGVVMFWIVMVVLNLNSQLLYLPFEATRKALSVIGL